MNIIEESPYIHPSGHYASVKGVILEGGTIADVVAAMRAGSLAERFPNLTTIVEGRQFICYYSPPANKGD